LCQNRLAVALATQLVVFSGLKGYFAESGKKFNKFFDGDFNFLCGAKADS